jgi:uncharacterized protein YciI
MHYLLFYDYAADYLERRGEFRAVHLSLAWAAEGRGELLLAGVLDEPMDTGVLLFRADSAAVVEAFVAADPYVQGGLVKAWRVRPWHTVVGAQAQNPVRP